MGADVRTLPGTGRRDPQAVIEECRGIPMMDVVVIGVTPQNQLFFTTSCDDEVYPHFLMHKVANLLLTGNMAPQEYPPMEGGS